jgi:hypothetical protein
MAITMRGSWTVSVKSRGAAFNQRFVITGASSGNGNHAGVVGNSVFVSGTQWSVNIQSQAPGQPWIDSRQRINFPTVSTGLVHFDIRSDDTGADLDFNDLVLTCSMPVSASEFVVYGNAKTYSGFCYWNPCYPWYYLIETAAQLEAALKVPELRRIIEKLYPQRVPKRPGPTPDPGPLFKTLMIPTGTPVENSGLVFRSAATRAPQPEGEITEEKDVRAFHEAAIARLRGTARPVSFDGSPVTAGSALLSREDLLTLAKISDKSRIFAYCDVEPAPGLLLGFQEYDRTSAEKLGGPYTGTGERESLGLAATDELGNYVFRFSRSLSDIADETLDVGTGELLTTQIFPDVIAQALGTGMAVDFEAGPYYNILNLTRIDLCMPYGSVHPSTGQCAGHDRIITKIGDIIVLHSALGGSPNTLNTGRITCRNANAPQVDCAAWRGGLRAYACFGKPAVSHYTMRYFRHGIDSDWQFVDEPFLLNHIPDFAPGYIGTSVGSTLRSVHVDGGASVIKPTYDNHEGDSNWIENDLKLILSTGYYRPAGNAGLVDFRIQGYDSAGTVVAGIDDTLTLFVDNDASVGDIESISMGITELGDCALFTLATPDAPLSVNYRAFDVAGFVQDWTLSVTRGNNFHFPVTVDSGVTMTNEAGDPFGVARGYPTPGACSTFRGTADEITADADNYVSTTLKPRSGNWLPAGQIFCAFAFTLEVHDRVTDGRNGYPRSIFWQDLIGLSADP